MKLSKIVLFAALSGSPALLFADSHFGVGIDIGIPVPRGVVISEAPPAPLIEQAVPAPGPNFVWVGGHWAWRGHWRRWVWVRGHWILPPSGASAWVPGHWAQAPSGWVWVEGQWRVSQAAPPPVPVADVYVDQAPPPPVYEAVTAPPPGPDFFWIGGFWGWSGGWVWHRGHYERHPHFHPGAGWEPGRWDHRGGRYVWVAGHWR
jgi:hypothetical protein